MALKLRGPVVDGNFKKMFDLKECITSEDVEKYLSENKGVAEIDVSTNGGDAFVGIEICNMIKKHGNVTVTIFDRALSAGAVIATGAKTIKIYDNAVMLIHSALTTVSGNASDLRKTAENLDALDNALVNTFKSRFKGTDEELKSLMAEDKLINAEEALKYGLVDEIIKDEESEEEKIIEILSEQKKISNKYVFDFNKKINTENTVEEVEESAEKNFAFNRFKKGEINNENK